MLEHKADQAKTITDVEMRELVHRLGEIDTSPTTTDVAEALGIPESRVQAVLADIRASTSPTRLQVQANQRQIRLAVMAIVLVATITAALIGMLMIGPPSLPPTPHLDPQTAPLPPADTPSAPAPSK